MRVMRMRIHPALMPVLMLGLAPLSTAQTHAPESNRTPTAHEVQSLVEGTWELTEWQVGDETLRPPQASGLWSLHDGRVLFSVRRSNTDRAVSMLGSGTYAVDGDGFRYGYDRLTTVTEITGSPAIVSSSDIAMGGFGARREPGAVVLEREDGSRALRVTDESMTCLESERAVRIYRRVGPRRVPSAPAPRTFDGGVEERGAIDLVVAAQPVVKRYVLRYPAADAWNGGVVIGAHGGSGGDAFDLDGRVMSTGELALDDVIGEHAVRAGFAYASVDRNGIAASAEGVEIVGRFADRMRSRLADAMRRTVARMYLVGLSMGGGITRMAAEIPDNPYDGAVIIAGASGDLAARLDRTAQAAALWPIVDPRIESPLPDDDPRVERYAAAVGTPVAARPFWPYTGVSATYANLRRSLEGYGLTGLSDADLEAFSVDRYRHEATFMARLGAGNTTGRVAIPTIEVVGTYDDLVIREIRAYRAKVEHVSTGAASPTPLERHRLYEVDGLWHISGDDDAILSFRFGANRMDLGPAIQDAMANSGSYIPAVRDALTLLDRWVRNGAEPPANRTVAASAGLLP